LGKALLPSDRGGFLHIFEIKYMGNTQYSALKAGFLYSPSTPSITPYNGANNHSPHWLCNYGLRLRVISSGNQIELKTKQGPNPKDSARNLLPAAIMYKLMLPSTCEQSSDLIASLNPNDVSYAPTGLGYRISMTSNDRPSLRGLMCCFPIGFESEQKCCRLWRPSIE
jgi:hypothetical protein